MEGELVDPHLTPSPPPRHVTTAVNRSWSDLNVTKWAVLIVAGAALRSTLMHPFYVAMARKRVSTENHSTLDILRQLKNERGGLRNWFRAYPCELTGNALGEATHLLAVEFTREEVHRRYERWRRKPSGSETDERTTAPFSDAIGGMIGDSAVVALVTPFSVVCNRQMTAGYGISRDLPYRSASNTLRSIWAEGGLRSVYKGASASIVMLPGAGLWWAAYGEFKFRFYALQSKWCATLGGADSSASHHRDSKWWCAADDNAFINSAASAAASALTVVAVNPVNVVRTRMQATHLGLAGVCRELWAGSRWRGFYKGTLVSVNVAVFDGVLFSLLYEFTKIGSDVTLTSA